MKKVLQILSILFLFIIGINNVKALEGVYCEYGDAWFRITAEDEKSRLKLEAAEKYDAVIKDVILGAGSPNKTLSDNDEIDWLINLGILVDEGEKGKKWSCPNNSVFHNQVPLLTIKKIVGLNYLKVKVGNTTSVKSVSCGSVTDIPAALPVFIKNIVNIIKIVVPIILIIMGMLDFSKAVVANDEKVMKEAQNKFIKRIIAAIVVFLVVAITQFIFNIVGTNDTNEMAACIDCFINGSCK